MKPSVKRIDISNSKLFKAIESFNLIPTKNHSLLAFLTLKFI